LGSEGLWSLLIYCTFETKLIPSWIEFELIALESPTFTVYTHWSTTITKIAQVPDLLTHYSFWNATVSKNLSSVLYAASFIAAIMFFGNSVDSIILLWKLSFINSAHFWPPWPSKTPKIWIWGHCAIRGCFSLGYTTFRIIAILSSLLFRTVPTFVFAAKHFTIPYDFYENFDGKNWCSVVDLSYLVLYTNFAI